MASQREAQASCRLHFLELHMPVVQPTRCTRTEEVEPQQQWALGEVMMRTFVEVMVER
jgi:hypothetical protein